MLVKSPGGFVSDCRPTYLLFAVNVNINQYSPPPLQPRLS